MNLQVISDPDEFSALGPDWLDLWRRFPAATPFQSPMWLLPWWRHFGSNELTVIAIRDGDKLQALAPLYVVRDDCESLGLLLGTGISDYLDVLADRDQCGEIVNMLTSFDCAAWDLQQLRPSSPILQATWPGRWSDNIEDQDPCVVLALDDLDNRLSTHFRKKLRYYRRSLERMAEVSFEDATAENLDSMLDALFALHAVRWQRRGMPGMLADDVVQKFHRQVARAMLDAGALRLYAMRSAERVVAVFYGFADATTVYYYLSGYDPELEKFSPGTLIVAQAIECARRDGARQFDFLRGAEQYKYAWGATDRMNRRRQLVRG